MNDASSRAAVPPADAPLPPSDTLATSDVARGYQAEIDAARAQLAALGPDSDQDARDTLAGRIGGLVKALNAERARITGARHEELTTLARELFPGLGEASADVQASLPAAWEYVQARVTALEAATGHTLDADLLALVKLEALQQGAARIEFARGRLKEGSELADKAHKLFSEVEAKHKERCQSRQPPTTTETPKEIAARARQLMTVVFGSVGPDDDDDEPQEPNACAPAVPMPPRKRSRNAPPEPVEPLWPEDKRTPEQLEREATAAAFERHKRAQDRANSTHWHYRRDIIPDTHAQARADLAHALEGADPTVSRITVSWWANILTSQSADIHIGSMRCADQKRRAALLSAFATATTMDERREAAQQIKAAYGTA